jgi:predicted DCC family thiol-disulfide oxidoreductase YuxK
MEQSAIMLFDRDCGFCTTIASWWERHLRDGDSSVACSYQSFRELETFGITREKASQALHVIEGSVISVGGDGVLVALSHMTWPYRALWLVGKNRFGRSVARRLYPLVAKNRHRLPGATSTCVMENHANVS